MSSKLMLTLPTFDICIYQSSSCLTTRYLVDIYNSLHKWIMRCSNTFVRLEYLTFDNPGVYSPLSYIT